MSDPTKALLLKHGHHVARQFLQLVKGIDQDDPQPADLKALRDMLDAHPELWRIAGDLAHAAALNLVDKLDASPLIAESLKRGWRAMQDELGHWATSPLDRLLIEQVVLCWLHLHVIQLEYTNVMQADITPSHAQHWERRLSATQRRYLRACESLARIRKLARTTPALQLNIAAPGAQQLNLLATDPSHD